MLLTTTTWFQRFIILSLSFSCHQRRCHPFSSPLNWILIAKSGLTASSIYQVCWVQSVIPVNPMCCVFIPVQFSTCMIVLRSRRHHQHDALLSFLLVLCWPIQLMQLLSIGLITTLSLHTFRLINLLSSICYVFW